MSLKYTKLLLPLVLVLTIGAALSACNPAVKVEKLAKPADPVVDRIAMRSVLDSRPRMLSLQLSDDMWAAYDTDGASLYKVWGEGVHWQGTVFNTMHGPQPVSMGSAFLLDDGNDPWTAISGDGSRALSAQYRGHQFEGASPRKASLLYEFNIDGSLVSVSEHPDIIKAHGRMGLERVFMVKGLSTGILLSLRLKLNSLDNEQAIETNGELTQFTYKRQDGTDGFSANVELRLTNGQTELITWFTPKPQIAEVIEDEGVAKPRGLRMIEASDCAICHNQEMQTVGPSWRAIAEKYPNTAGTVDILSDKVIEGGGGVWGDAPMTPHADLSFGDVATMLLYILAMDGEEHQGADGDDSDGVSLVGRSPNSSSDAGIAGNFYSIPRETSTMPEVSSDQAPIAARVISAINANSDSDFGPLTKFFYLQAAGFIEISEPGTYTFRIISDDGSVLEVDGEELVNNDGSHSAIGRDGRLKMTAGKHPFTLHYFQAGGAKAISLLWRPPGTEEFSVIPPEVFTHDKAFLREPETSNALVWTKVPGFTAALEAVHPSFQHEVIRPEGFEPMVGGLDVFPDGRVALSTWDEKGQVYVLSNVDADDRNDIQVTRIGHGLAEPLGLKIVDGEIYILQKHELTKLVDLDGDGIIDRYETVSNNWDVTANFHEFAFGLIYRDGYFYAAFATAVLPGGAGAPEQANSRGKAVKISRQDGSVEILSHGFRTPNGIGFGVDNEIFIADNQGDWLPSSKILHVRKGVFFGSRAVDFEGIDGLQETPPVVWLPQDEIGNSPSQPAIINVGPYAGQMIHGEVTHGGIKRVFVEKVAGEYQGAVFRFTQGLEAGVNRIVWGPDGRLYIGGIGNPGNWGHAGKLWFGLERLTYNGESTFEMLAVRARSNGMEIEFTEPLAFGDGHDPADYDIQQWRYVPDENYGGPKVDLEVMQIESVNVSDDRRKVFLELAGLKAGHVVYINLVKHFISAEDHRLWAGEAWYTLNAIPQNNPGLVATQAFIPLPDNTLNPDEVSAGFRSLFDGKAASEWHAYGSDQPSQRWKADNDVLAITTADKEAGEERSDLVSNDEFENFEFRFEWMISKGGNSGVMFMVVESDEYRKPWQTGPEIQILDNENAHGASDTQFAGELYDLMEGSVLMVKPQGEWNESRLILRDNHLQHWLNGVRVIDIVVGSEDWSNRVAASKFADMPGFGVSRKGRIALQDHGDPVSFRNLRIREF